MKLFLTYLLLIAPTAKAAAGISGVTVTLFYFCALLAESEYVKPLPGLVGILGAALLAVFVLLPSRDAANVLLEALK